MAVIVKNLYWPLESIPVFASCDQVNVRDLKYVNVRFGPHFANVIWSNAEARVQC